MSVLPVPSHLNANPHWYDYIHSIDFRVDSRFELVDGAGQVINGEARGRFIVRETGPETAEIRFVNIGEYNPYSGQRLRDLDDLTVQLTRERGTFMLREEVMWRIENPHEQPYLVYPTRYILDTDPLAFTRERQKFNLYQLTEKRDFVESVRCYYNRDEGHTLTIAQMIARGYNVDSLLE